MYHQTRVSGSRTLFRALLSFFCMATNPVALRISLPGATIWRWILLWVMVGYLALYLWFLWIYVEPSFLGLNGLRIGADSQEYLVLAGVLRDNGMNQVFSLVSFGGNFFGPIILAKAIPSIAGIALFNLALFGIGLWVADTLPGVRLGWFFLAMVLNPLTTISFLTLSKEAFSFFAVILLAKYIADARKSRWLLLLMLFFSFLARWEQCLFTMLFLAADHRRSPLRGRRWLTLFLLVLAVTVVYPLLARGGLVDMASMLSVAEGGAIVPKLNTIQAHYGFALIVIPKIVLNLFGQVLRPSYFFSDFWHGDFTDLQNNFALPLDTVAMFVVCIIAAVKRRLDIRKDSIYWIAIYLVTTAATPLFQPRYQFPVYIMLCLEICGFRSHLTAQPLPRRSRLLASRGYDAAQQTS